MANATEWAPDADQTLVRAAINLLKGTSATSMTIASSGSFTFLTQTYLYFAKSEWILLVDNANPDNWMAGQITSYDPLTGSTVFVSKVSHGSGTISNWLVYLAGAWIDNPWTGGTINNPVQINNTLGVTGVSTLARVNASAPITSTAGEINLNTTTTLTDADQTLTAAQLFGSTLVISPTAARVLTLPTAAQIIAFMTGYVPGSKFQFTLVNTTLNSITIAPGAGIVQYGKTLILDGSAIFKVTIDSPTVVSVINESTFSPASIAGQINSSQTQSSAADITLINTSSGLQLITMTAEGLSVKLPDATTLYVLTPVFVIKNNGYYPFGVRDGSGNLLAVVEPSGTIELSLTNNSSVAGVWIYSGIKILSGMIAFTSLLGTAYDSATIYNLYAALSATQTVHFCKVTANGLAVFMVDSAAKTVSAPAVITSTAGSVVKAVFPITSTSFIVFYSEATNVIRAVVVVVSAGVLIAATPASITATAGIGIDNGSAAPKIAQLDTNLFLISYATADGAGTTSVVACQVSGTTVATFGSAADINVAATNCINSTVTLPLTTTTALVLYKLTSAPFTNKAVVISVTNANPPVCTVGTSVSCLNSTIKNAASCTKLDAATCLIADDDNSAGGVSTKVLSISGTTVTANATTVMDTGLGATIEYDSKGATRYNPHLFPLSSSAFLTWWKDSSFISRVQIGTISGTTITAGLKVTGTFSKADSGSAGAGIMLPQGTNEFVGVIANGTAAAGSQADLVAITHKINGSTITVGKCLRLNNIIAPTLDPSTQIMSARLSNGVYAVTADLTGNPLSGDIGVKLFKTDGVNIIDLGIITDYASGYVGSTPQYMANYGTRLISLAAEAGYTSPATIPQLRVTSMEVTS